MDKYAPHSEHSAQARLRLAVVWVSGGVYNVVVFNKRTKHRIGGRSVALFMHMP